MSEQFCFVDYLGDLIGNSGHPGIEGVERYDVPEGGVTDPKVACTDGTS